MRHVPAVATARETQLFTIESDLALSKMSLDMTEERAGDVDHDFVALMHHGKIYGTENGCFAKTFGLDPKHEPTIYGAVTKRDAYLENVSQKEGGEVVDFFDTSYTQNGRATFELSALGWVEDARNIGPVDVLLILNRNDNIIPGVARLDSEHAAAYFREMARALKPGGTIMIQMPLHQWPANLKPVVRGWFAGAHNAYMALRRIKGWYHRFRLSRHQWSPFMQSITYDAAWVHDTLSALGFQDVEMCSFRLSRGGAVYSWVFARKASQA